MPQKNHKNSQFAIDFLLSCHWFQCLQFFFSPQIFSRSAIELLLCAYITLFSMPCLATYNNNNKNNIRGKRKQEVSRESGDGTDGKVNSMKSENVMGILWWSMKEVSSFAQHSICNSLSASLDDTRDIFFSLSCICLFSCFRFLATQTDFFRS